jgi:hypothetical protein
MDKTDRRYVTPSSGRLAAACHVSARPPVLLVMLIRVVTTSAEVPRTGEAIAFVHGEIQPRIAAMEGNRGFAMAVDHRCGRYVSIAAWTGPEALEAGGGDAPGLIGDLARRLHGSEPSVEVFDLVLAHVVKPVRLGYWGRFSRLSVPVKDLARACRKFPQLSLAWFERRDGLAAIIVFVDPATGAIGSIFWYDSLRALRGADPRARELRDVLHAEIPSIAVVEDSELHAVIVEMSEIQLQDS